MSEPAAPAAAIEERLREDAEAHGATEHADELASAQNEGLEAEQQQKVSERRMASDHLNGFRQNFVALSSTQLLHEVWNRQSWCCSTECAQCARCALADCRPWPDADPGA